MSVAGIIDFGDLERKTCASCGCYWDYNIFDKSKLKTVFDKYFFLDIDYCPNCYYGLKDFEKLKCDMDKCPNCGVKLNFFLKAFPHSLHSSECSPL